jgi:DNA gyrase/topoisomerase IV subunit A
MKNESSLEHLEELRDRAHVLEGLALGHERWPEVSTLAFNTDEPDSFVSGLVELLKVDRLQALAIADMQVRRVGRLEREAVQRRLVAIRKQLKEAE